MINVIVYGADEFLGEHIEVMMLPALSKIYEVKEDEVIFTCLHSTIYHGGVDQTSFHIIIKVELDEKYAAKENDAAKYILDASKNFAVHARVQFNYLKAKEYVRVNEEYPLFVSKSNEVAYEESDDEEETEGEEEIYTGNIFADFEDKLK